MLLTKCHRPEPAPDLVPRPHLIQRLNAGVHNRLVLLSAPAGFGKTSLLVQWLPDATTAWLALDDQDTTPEGFWRYVIAALQTVAPELGRLAQAALQAPDPPPVETVVTALVNDLAVLAHPLTLVLDDYHLITTPEIHTSLAFLLDHLPRSLQLVVATREDPPLALARLRARGQLSEIRAADLRFSAEETATFFNQVHQLALEPADVATLVQRSEGWATALRLTLLSLRQNADRSTFIAAFSASHRFVTDYLVEEVLARLDRELQQFLRRTAILQRFCAPLCDAVLDITESSMQLRRIEQANIFLVSLDHDRHWYRYHHLFAEFLRLELRTHEPELVPLLYHRAIDWCRQEGLLREALSYAFAAGDHRQAADLIEALATETLGREGPAAVLEWISRLSDELVRERPLLCIAYAWALTFAGRGADAITYLAAAEAASTTVDAATRTLIAGPVAAHQAYVRFFQGSFGEALAYARLALELLPPQDLLLRSRATLVLCTVLRFAARFAEAEEALAPLAVALEATPNVYIAMLYFSSLGEIRQEQCRLHEARAIFQQAIEAGERYTGHTDNPFTGIVWIAIGHLYWEWNDLPAAGDALHRGLALCREWRQADALVIGLIELARLEQVRGNVEAARRAIAEIRQIAATMGSPWGRRVAGMAEVQLAIGGDDLRAVADWVRVVEPDVQNESAHTFADGVLSAETVADEDLNIGRLEEDQVRAAALVVLGEHTRAHALLADLVRRFRREGRIYRLVGLLAWQARILAETDQVAEARTVLDEALALAEPQGVIRTLVEVGRPIAELLGTLADAGHPRRAYIARLLAALSDEPPVPHESTHSVPDALLEPLKDRELAVLRLMAAGLSNRAIGDELFLSVNTVRWYAGQIFAKLGVSGRFAAVAQARSLGLLDG
jgi:LuxR family maltose regulon positive regulatory protein